MSRLVLTDEETVADVMPGDSALPTGVQAAAAYIRELLLRPGRYRRMWEQYAERSRAGQEVNSTYARYKRTAPLADR